MTDTGDVLGRAITIDNAAAVRAAAERVPEAVRRYLGARALRAAAEDFGRSGATATTHEAAADWMSQRANVIAHGQLSI